METLKEGLVLSTYRKETSRGTRIIMVVFILIFGIPLFLNLLPLIWLFVKILNFDNTWGGILIESTLFGLLLTSIIVLPIIYSLYHKWGNPGVYYFKGSLWVFNDEKLGEQSIPLGVVDRFILFDNLIFLVYNDLYIQTYILSPDLSYQLFPRNLKKSVLVKSPEGCFKFKLTKKLIKHGPSLIDELNKKTQLKD